jgi:cytidylate kinase
VTGRSRPVVAIDGPAGAGKSTVARLLARRLGFTLVDTGALYRAVALAATERGVAWDDEPGLEGVCRSISLRLETAADGATCVVLDGRDRSSDIRTPEISRGASAVSARPGVRAALLGMQRELGKDGGVVLEGRDIGTVVFPDAEVKVFLTASAQERARRRTEELRGRGIAADFAETLAEVEARDAQDAGRAIAPLRPADDAVRVDSTGVSVPELIDRLAALVPQGAGKPRSG